MTKQERIDQLKLYLDKFAGIYKHHNENILWNVIEFIQTLLEFSFMVEDFKNTPKFILGEDKSEEDTTKTKTYEKPLIFLKLNKRCYAPVNDENRKLFANTEVLLASFPTMTKTFYLDIENEDGKKEQHPYQSRLFYSDNEFLLTLKTKTLKEQYEIINVMERTFNIYAKKFAPEMILACAIVRMESKELKDKDDLKTINIYFQLRLKEIIDYDDKYLLKAFYFFCGKDDTFVINGSEGNFEPVTKVEYFPPKKEKVNNNERNYFLDFYE